MDWLESTTSFERRDLRRFSFQPGEPIDIRTVEIRLNAQDEATWGPYPGKCNPAGIDRDPKIRRSVDDYWNWIKHCRSSKSSCRPALFLAMHKRIEDNTQGREPMKSTCLPYEGTDFQSFCAEFYQHRSLASIIGRRSTAVFTSRVVTWKGSGRSIIYHCKSDTESELPPNDDIVLSATCFIDIPITFAVMYGCTDNVIKDTATWLRRCGKAAFHPLILPMIFAELERTRFVNATDMRANQLNPRIIALRNRANRKMSTTSSSTSSQPKKRPTINEVINLLGRLLNSKDIITALKRRISQLRNIINKRKSTTLSNTNFQPSNDTTTNSDCDAIDIARSMRTLMNGLESFREQLTLMKDHLQTLAPGPSKLGPSLGAGQEIMHEPKVYIEGRLQDMLFEFRSKIRGCEVLVGTMTLVTQMELNYFTRRVGQISFNIAMSTTEDSTQMKQISVLGVLFLPGSLVASIFSMSIFKWIPEDSNQVVSPWLALYFGVTGSLMLVTYFVLKTKTSDGIETTREKVYEELDNEDDRKLFPKGELQSALTPLSDPPVTANSPV